MKVGRGTPIIPSRIQRAALFYDSTSLRNSRVSKSQSESVEEKSENNAPQGNAEVPEDLTPPNIFTEFYLFLKEEKIWWMAPMIIILLLIGIVMFIGQTTPALAPFLYPLF